MKNEELMHFVGEYVVIILHNDLSCCGTLEYSVPTLAKLFHRPGNFCMCNILFKAADVRKVIKV